jgi:hypothetical protein
VSTGNNPPFLTTSRSFQDVDVREQPELFNRILNKFSEDVSNNVNVRTIGFYDITPSLNGNSFLGNPVYRVVVPFLSFTTTVTLNTPIVTSGMLTIVALYGITQSNTTASPIPSPTISVSFDLISGDVTLTGTGTMSPGFICIEYYYSQL